MLSFEKMFSPEEKEGLDNQVLRKKNKDIKEGEKSDVSMFELMRGMHRALENQLSEHKDSTMSADEFDALVSGVHDGYATILKEGDLGTNSLDVQMHGITHEMAVQLADQLHITIED